MLSKVRRRIANDELVVFAQLTHRPRFKKQRSELIGRYKWKCRSQIPWTHAARNLRQSRRQRIRVGDSERVRRNLWKQLFEPRNPAYLATLWLNPLVIRPEVAMDETSDIRVASFREFKHQELLLAPKV